PDTSGQPNWCHPHRNLQRPGFFLFDLWPVKFFLRQDPYPSSARDPSGAKCPDGNMFLPLQNFLFRGLRGFGKAVDGSLMPPPAQSLCAHLHILFSIFFPYIKMFPHLTITFLIFYIYTFATLIFSISRKPHKFLQCIA